MSVQVNVKFFTTLVPLNRGHRQVLCQPRLDPARSGAWSPAAMGRGKSLVQVEMDDVETHVAGTGDANKGLEVGAVVVQQRACLVGQPRDLGNVSLEEPKRV